VLRIETVTFGEEVGREQFRSRPRHLSDSMPPVPSRHDATLGLACICIIRVAVLWLLVDDHALQATLQTTILRFLDKLAWTQRVHGRVIDDGEALEDLRPARGK